ncbi:MAG: hypothetical protein KJ065_27620 [Anaerolineae bacterium]|nr:hypothetical protein [Anaerolineae bacterium]
MSKRFTLFIVLLSVLLLLAAPAMVQATPVRYEGIYLHEWPRREPFGVEITATKMIAGGYRQSLVNIQYIHAVTCYYPRFNETVVLQEDPDELSVSRDLGWGGLHGWAIVHDQCSNTDMLMEFHVDLFANTPAVNVDPATGYYTREARLTGYILLNGEIYWDFSQEPHGDYHEYAYSFSSRVPYPIY